MKWRRCFYRILFTLPILFLSVACRPDSPAPAAGGAESEGPATTTAAPTTTPTGTPSPTPTATGEPTNTPTATPAPSETPLPTATTDPAAPAVVTIPGVDNITSTGTFYPGLGQPPWPGVILLHMSGGDRHIWEENGFAATLVAEGYAVLAVDIRNHGDSGGDPSWEKAEADIRRWWNTFSGRQDVDGSRTALVGGSIGANLALFAAAAKTDVRTIVLLSPGFDYNSAPVADTVVEYGPRPMFIVASADDLFPAVEDAETMAELAQGTVKLQLYEDAGHGTEMLPARPELAGLIVAWLDTYVKPETPAAPV